MAISTNVDKSSLILSLDPVSNLPATVSQKAAGTTLIEITFENLFKLSDPSGQLKLTATILLDQCWTYAKELTGASTKLACYQTCEKVLLLVQQKYSDFKRSETQQAALETYTFTFKDGTLRLKGYQIEALKKDSPVLKLLFEGAFKEGTTAAATFPEISQTCFEDIMK